MKTYILQYVKDFLGLFYPNTCSGCENYLMRQEEGICLECLYKLPKTNFKQDAENPVSQIFWGKVEINYALALYYYEYGGLLRKLIQNLKYHNDTLVGVVLGRLLAHEIKKVKDFKVDVIVPVPLHKKKLKKRGYNQCDFIIKGMQEVLPIEANFTNLIRTKFTETQTKLDKIKRWENVMQSFALRNEKSFEGKHVLLVDDVITSGATIEACATALLKNKGGKVSIACLGKAN